MSYVSWNGIIEVVKLPTATNGTNSNPFVMPKGAKSLQIHVPALVGAAATLLIQALQPKLQDNETDVWTGVTVFDLTDGTFEALDALPESTVVTIPATALGGGVFRFVASEAQTGAAEAIEVRIVWGMDE